MKLKKVFFILVLIAALYFGYQYTQDTIPIGNIIVPPDETFTIANWNIQTLGDTKWGKEEIREKILTTLPNYDIIFIQEIRDKDGSVFEDLCNELQNYECEISSRAGRSTSKEQYGVVYKNYIEIIDAIDYNSEENNEYWERPPLRVDFKVEDYYFTAYNIHIKPDDVDSELDYLERLAYSEENQENVILLGDFNADGSYYDEEDNLYFQDHHWIVKNKDDTTVAASDNTYDRIIINDNMFKEYVSYGIYTDIEKEVSDHYLVWVEIG